MEIDISDMDMISVDDNQATTGGHCFYLGVVFRCILSKYPGHCLSEALACWRSRLPFSVYVIEENTVFNRNVYLRLIFENMVTDGSWACHKRIFDNLKSRETNLEGLNRMLRRGKNCGRFRLRGAGGFLEGIGLL